jgi:hypothetical protein
MARINLNEFGGQAGGLAYRVNQVRTDPDVVKAAQVALIDVKDATRSCRVLAREATASWQRTRPTPPQSGANHAGRTVTPPQSTHDQQDRPDYRVAS